MTNKQIANINEQIELKNKQIANIDEQIEWLDTSFKIITIVFIVIMVLTSAPFILSIYNI